MILSSPPFLFSSFPHVKLVAIRANSCSQFLACPGIRAWPLPQKCANQNKYRMKSDSPSVSSTVSSASLSTDLPWWKTLNRYHWFVFLVASLAWLFDCLDQHLFILARNSAF